MRRIAPLFLAASAFCGGCAVIHAATAFGSQNEAMSARSAESAVGGGVAEALVKDQTVKARLDAWSESHGGRLPSILIGEIADGTPAPTARVVNSTSEKKEDNGVWDGHHAMTPSPDKRTGRIRLIRNRLVRDVRNTKCFRTDLDEGESPVFRLTGRYQWSYEWPCIIDTCVFTLVDGEDGSVVWTDTFRHEHPPWEK